MDINQYSEAFLSLNPLEQRVIIEKHINRRSWDEISRLIPYEFRNIRRVYNKAIMKLITNKTRP